MGDVYIEEILDNPLLDDDDTEYALKPGHRVTESVAKKKKKELSWELSEENKIISYLVIAVVIIMIVVYVITNVMGDYLLYTEDTNFPGYISFIIGLVFMVALTTYVSYMSDSCTVFWGYILFFVFFILWTINLALRTEYHVKGVIIHNNGSFYLIAAIIFLLVMMYCVGNTLELIFLIPVLLWILYLLYGWWFLIENKDTRKVQNECY